MIVAIVFGINLFNFLLFSLFPFSLSAFASSNLFDWNPLATIFGSIITGLITWLAVYKTAKFDKDARLYEFRYKHFIENLNSLNENLKMIYGLTYYFEKDNDCIMSKSLDEDLLLNDKCIREFKKTFEYLCKINSKFALKTSNIPDTFNEFVNIYNFMQRQVAEHRWYLNTGDIKYKKDFISKIGDHNLIYCVDKLLDYYKSKNGIQYDISAMNNAIKDLKSIIEEEFKLN